MTHAKQDARILSNTRNVLQAMLHEVEEMCDPESDTYDPLIVRGAHKRLFTLVRAAAAAARGADRFKVIIHRGRWPITVEGWYRSGSYVVTSASGPDGEVELTADELEDVRDTAAM